MGWEIQQEFEDGPCHPQVDSKIHDVHTAELQYIRAKARQLCQRTL